MPALKAIRRFAEDLLSFQKFVLSYQETTVYQMQQVRDDVLGSRTFMEGLLEAFFDIKHSQQPVQRNILGRPKATKQQFETLTKNGKSAAVFITFETRLAGAAMSKTFELFTDFLRQNPDVLAVLVGQTGQQMFAKSDLSERANMAFPLSENLQNEADMTALLNFLLSFQNVNVFVPMFKSLVSQPPRMVNLTGENTLSDLEKTSPQDTTKKATGILFEPAYTEMKAFFEVQIVAALFRQLTQEARLANLAGRIATLEQTYYSLAQQIAKLDHEERLAKRKLQDKRQRARLSGMLLWR